MSNASRYGFKKSIIFNVGVSVGFFAMLLLCGLFTATTYALIPAIKPFISIAGAAYILWLALKIYKSKPIEESSNQKRTNSFTIGFILQFVNPKAILFGLTTASTFIIPYFNTIPALAGFSVLLACTAFLATSSWGLFGSVFQKFISEKTQMVNTIMASLLVYCAVSLFL